ncbi:MAG: LicD family protein [Oscillospiraceae bacterium]|nr:LicD family protein [Oscillospiraceae bacterium]
MAGPNQLNDTQKYILHVLREVTRVLDELQIPYYMQGGTMLGAIRHEGFIPWDDDVDLGIPRADYERLLKTVAEHLPEDLELRTYDDETDHHYYFARIVDKRYQIRRMGSLEERLENIWVDLFPLDGMPDGWLPRQWHKARLLMTRLKYHLSTLEKVNIKRPGRALIERIIIKIAMITRVGKWFKTRKQLDKMDRLLKKYPPEKSKYLINFTGQTSYKFNEMFKKEVYGKKTYYPFEDFSLVGPEQYDVYLRSLYGDYMTPPKESDRNAHVSELVPISEGGD